MATNYPGAIDALTNPGAGDALNAPSHSGQHANANDAIEAIEAELGTTPSGSESTVAARLTAIESGARMGTGSIGATALADNAVDTAAIQDGAVTSAKIADGTITATDVAAGTFAAFGMVGNILKATAAECSADWQVGVVTPQYSTPSAGYMTLPSGFSYALPKFDTTGSEAFRSPVAKPGEVWTARVDLTVTGGTSAHMALFFADATGATLLQMNSSTVLAGSSATRSVTGVAPAGTVEVAMAVYRDGSPEVIVSNPGMWKGAGGKWAMPGTPIPGGSRIAVNNAVDLSGTGTPEGVVTAAPGSTFLQTDSTVDVKGWIRWVKASGTGNTGWIAGPEADTGWRRIVTTDGTADWTAGELRLRRTGNTVFLVAETVGVSALDKTIYTCPAGFVGHPRALGAVLRETVATGNPYWFDVSNGAVMPHGKALIGTFATSHRFEGSWSWHVLTTAWPSSLPGVAA